MTEPKIKYWWSSDKQWFCIQIAGATASLTPEEASLFFGNACLDPRAYADVILSEENDRLIAELFDTEQHVEKWFAKACENQALMMVAEATVTALRCDCGASEGGTKWGGVHTADCATVKTAVTAGDAT